VYREDIIKKYEKFEWRKVSRYYSIKGFTHEQESIVSFFVDGIFVCACFFLERN
jgi:hypothetical protein